MAKFWRSPQFVSLKEEWDKKLAATGFEDAEKEINGELALKRVSLSEGKWGGVYRHAHGLKGIHEKADYFRVLSQKFLQEEQFDDDLDRLIMERTMEGKSIKEISDELKGMLSPGQTRSKHNRDTIRYIRRRYENKWGIRIWSQFNMQSRKKKAATQ